MTHDEVALEEEFARASLKRATFGRLLAYVYVSDVMLNAEMLRKGLAETLTIPPNDAESGRFERIEERARRAGVGIWGECR